ncbi:hypothetical protein AB3Z07_21205 [Metabacillus halosaccharovorans]|uniref:hypothetical protein n=1 Tax=Metabacillus halosaccharovorans TaxID=930124 RepID=UPI0034CDD780
MKYHVISNFRDKETFEVYTEGSIFETDKDKRVKELQHKGYLGEKIEVEIPDILKKTVSEIKHEITEEMDQEQLQELLQFEVDTENRKGVKEHIESLLKGDDNESSKA